MNRTRRTSLFARAAATASFLALAPVALSTGCSFGEVYLHDPLLREAALAEIQLHYSSLIRWSAFYKAAKYVDPDAREDFLALLPPLDEFRFTDFESEPIDIDEVTGEATIHVTYKGYSVRSPYEISVVETQQWKRQSAGNTWKVTSEFQGLGETAGLAKAD